jgi:hypothetical protein
LQAKKPGKFRIAISHCEFIQSAKPGKEIVFMSTPLNMHAARTALNQDPELRKWVEGWLRNKERTVQDTMTTEEFEKHWLYVRPERMHEGALEALAAYAADNKAMSE